MATERRWQKVLLGALVVVLLVIVYWIWPAAPSATPAPASNNQAAASGQRAQQHQVPAAETFDVHLQALDDDRPKPGATDRNLFRFKAKVPPPPPPGPGRSTQPTTTTVAQPPAVIGPPQPPPMPPIALKFLGTIEKPGQGGLKIAMLSDGRGSPFYGREGEVVEGRYRILKIGVESIEIAYADGRGRQTIRLTGQ